MTNLNLIEKAIINTANVYNAEIDDSYYNNYELLEMIENLQEEEDSTLQDPYKEFKKLNTSNIHKCKFTLIIFL